MNTDRLLPAPSPNMSVGALELIEKESRKHVDNVDFVFDQLESI